MRKLPISLLLVLGCLSVWGQPHSATMVRDSVLNLGPLVKNSRTVTLKGMKIAPVLLRFAGMAIGEECFTFSPSWKGGTVYSMANGDSIRPLTAKSFLDQSEGFALEPTSERADKNGRDLWMRATHIQGMSKHNAVVRVNMETGIVIDSIPTPTSVYFREPQEAGDTLAYNAQDLSALWKEYGLPFGKGLRSVRTFGHCLWLNINNSEFFLYDTREQVCRQIKEIVLDGKTWPAADLVGFGPRHLAVGECGDNEIQLTICELVD